MEHEHCQMESQQKKTSRQYLLPVSIVIAAAMLSGAWLWTKNRSGAVGPAPLSAAQTAALEEKVLPSAGAVIPVRWGDLGKKLVADGVIDRVKFDALYAQRGGLNPDERALLENADNGQLTITPNNTGVLLNILWALGLANENPVLTKGMMQDKQFGGAQNFASTGGWSVGRGNPMSHYAMHKLMVLTDEQQSLVQKVAHGIYRSCCNNATDFPDCNHGMAMLGLLELMASQGATEEQMYKTALQVNAYWFPDTYLTIAQYLQTQGSSWEDADPRMLLGADYSNASGYRAIAAQVQPKQGSGSSCGV